MRRRRALLVTGLAVALLVSAGLWFVQHSHGPTSSAHRGPSSDVTTVVPGRTVYVESGVRSTTFLPLGPGPQDGRTLSAQRAYNLLVSDSEKLQPIPATVQPYYGVLTDASTSPKAIDLRVWGFAVESGCIRTGTLTVGGGATASGRPGRSDAGCRLWEFVNATTGHRLGVITQEVLPD